MNPCEDHVPSHTFLQRPRCRVAWAEPDEPGFAWVEIPLLPAPAPARTSASPPTEVRAAAGRMALHVRFDCGLMHAAGLNPPTPQAAMDEVEHAYIDLYPRNDPTVCIRFRADYRGLIEATRTRLVTGECSLEAVPDVWQETQPVPGHWDRYHGVATGRWFVEFLVPWKALGLPGRPPVFGFEYGRVFRTGLPWPVLDTAGWPEPKPTRGLETGEALLGPDAGGPDHIRLERPRFGINRGSLVLGPGWTRRPNCLLVRTEAPPVLKDSRPDQTPEAVAEFITPIEPGRDSVEFSYVLDRGRCSHAQVLDPPGLVLEARDGEDVLYQAVLPLDRHLGICVDEPYGEPPGSNRRSTAAAAGRTLLATVREVWLERVVRALPRLHRRNTLQAAPSDFCLAFGDGRTAANLMADDAWARLAALVEERFTTAEDRLVASMALVGQKSVTNLILGPQFLRPDGRAGYHTAMHEWMGPLSILRYGGGPAVARAAVLARLLQVVRNPRTGRSFVTRVISLTSSGGPRQVTRRYDGQTNLAPFVQQPGPVGAVAVDYATSQTLLDPTGLVFFPVSGDGEALATLEAILADESMLLGGAGRLAPFYARMDPEELRRHRPCRLWSRGVFPELCPDEDGPDTPFDPGYRQRPKVLVAPRGVESPPSEAFVETASESPGHEHGVRSATLTFLWDDRGFTARVQVRGLEAIALSPRDREMERVHLALDLRHDHQTFYHFLACLDGSRGLWLEEATGIQTLFKHLSTENLVEISEGPAGGWSAGFDVRPGGYTITFRCEWVALGVEGPDRLPVAIGLNAWIDARAPEYGQVFLSPPRGRMPADPFQFADLYLSGSPVLVTSIDLGVPTWGENTGRAEVMNRTDRDIEMTLQAVTRAGMARAVHRCEPVPARLPARCREAVAFPFFVDPEEKMMGDSPQSLVLSMAAEGREVFSATWHPTYCGTVSVYQRYGGNPAACPNPQPGEADFLDRKIRYLCSRIPVFRRLTTRDGAASDFVLRAEDGCVEFNLMRPGVLDEMAHFISTRFETDVDRLLGLFYLAYAPTVARHLSGGHRFMKGAGPLSVLRGNFAGGGGNCGFHARAFAGMAAHLRVQDQLLRAHTVAVRGHVITAVSWRGSKTLLDADVGHFLLTADGRDFPTLEEIRSGAALLSTAGPGDLARYLTFQLEVVAAAPGIRDEQFPGVFPPGAPKA
ncbi:MAG: hypothetical protein HYU36_00655 [Planctomycetes bacterium]|nr:hypothetical protein [Planctomycetota bacterium]